MSSDHRDRSHLGLAFVVFVSGVMFLSSLLILPLYMFTNTFGQETVQGRLAFAPLLTLLLVMMMIGVTVSALSGPRLVNVMTEISQATKRIAKGDFSVRIREQYRMREMSDMAVNFNKMVGELGGIETLRNDFVANVSHEFKTPLAAIEGYATLLRGHDLTAEEYDEYTRMIIEAAQQLSALSGNILRISKLENQQFVCEKSEFSLDEQLRQALLLLESQWSGKELELDLNLDPAPYYGSDDMLMQVWLNLLGNAIKFTPVGGRIAVTMRVADRDIRVVIIDSGCGMDEETLRHIFEKFYQAEDSRRQSGNGLGLPLVKRILDLCGGSIEVESQPGSGSTFIVTLPREEKPTAATGKRPS